MPTYTFANKDAPVNEHMRGLVSGLELWLKDCELQIGRAKTHSETQYWRGMRDGFRDTIEAIKDSNSI